MRVCGVRGGEGERQQGGLMRLDDAGKRGMRGGKGPGTRGRYRLN